MNEHGEPRSPSEKEIFYKALDVVDSRQRVELIDAACQGDQTLRRGVEQLLAAHLRDGLETPEDGSSPGGRSQESDVEVGSVVGQFKLLEKIGEGGFGDVYMADQMRPIRRRVALKIIKAGMDTKQVIARFEAERQALALMDHPHIAKVFDAGATPTGRPYFVMELVRGIPVTEYCDANSLSMDERLKLFVQICSAVQHAHQKGIIHRDIKPSNILVGTNGDVPVPKVIDFGIAKATQGRLTEKTLFTHFRQFVGTPAYMSPEQAQMSAVDVDTRSDVYSLGVLLYELLTGRTPLDSQELCEAGFEEICRRIREEEPSKPSTRISSLTLDEQTQIAKQRRTEPSYLGHKMRGDLDWIIMKALDKDRARRYETADSLQLDVERFLRDVPVSAAAPSASYKVAKFVRRNRNTVAAVAVIVVLLVSGTAVSIWQAIRTTKQYSRAIRAEALAIEKEKRANVLRSRAETSEQMARRRQYAAEMLNAQRELAALNGRNTFDLLQRHIPRFGQTDVRGFEWRSLWYKFRQELFRLNGHTHPVTSIAFSPDGNWLASSSIDGTARLWDLQARQQVWCWKGSEYCSDVEFSPDGQKLLTVIQPGDNVLWDLSDPMNPREIRRFVVKGQFSPNGETIIGGRWSQGGFLNLWDPMGNHIRAYGDPNLGRDEVVRAHQGPINDVMFTHDGELVVSAGNDSTAKIWNTATGQLLHTLHGHHERVTGVATEPTDRGLIATASADGSVCVWDRAGNELRKLPPTNAPMADLDFSYDGTKLIVADVYGQIRVFETKSWSEITTFRSPGGGGLVEYSPTNPRHAATAGTDGVIRFWNTSATDAILDHPERVRALEFSPDGRILAVGMATGRVHFWDVDTKSGVWSTEKTMLDGRDVSSNNFITFSHDGKSVAIIGDNEHVSIWDMETRSRRAVIKQPIEMCKFWSVAFSPEGTHLFTGTAWSRGDQGVFVWNLSDPSKPIGKFEHRGPSGVESIVISQDGTMLVAGHHDLRLWETSASQQPQQVLPGRVSSLCFSPDESWLAAGGSDCVRIWDTQVWQETTLAHRDKVTSVDVSPAGDRLVAADVSGVTKLWDLATRQTVATYRASIARFSPDGQTLAIGCEGKRYLSSMPAAGRVRLIYAPPLAEIDAFIRQEDASK